MVSGGLPVGGTTVAPATWRRLGADLEPLGQPGREVSVAGGSPYAATVEIGVLGPVEVRVEGVAVDLGTPKQRALVCALALSQGRPVGVDTIVDLLWSDDAPPGVTATLQAYVSALRKVLEPHRAPRTPATVLVTVAPGYALRVPAGSADAQRFERVVGDEHRRLGLPLLGPVPLTAAELTGALERLDAALALWRGTPYAELGDAAPAVAARAHLEELRLVALEDRAAARLALGDHGTTAADLEALTAAHPLRERLWALRAVALTRAGRQADALEALRRLREVLADELGIDPSAELRALQDAVLQQDERLQWVPPDQGEAALPEPAPEAAPAESPRVARMPEQSRRLTGEVSWPMLGRDVELGRLLGALEAAEHGTASYAVLTGEPGIGKSRLSAELVDRAAARGFQVAVGRCSPDDGAPPLWPWTTVLEQLGQRLPDDGGVGEQFRVWEELTRRVRDAALERRLLVVLDDLHWADTATLRVLRLLAETSGPDRLMVLATWRDHPRPTGALADAAEALARRHAVRLELAGVDGDAVLGIFDAVADRRPSADQAASLRERTGGNPFFLVEYARLAASRGEGSRLLHEDAPPTAVQEVLTRRVERLPEQTVRALRVASVVGPEFGLGVLAVVTGVDEDDLLDVVEPAQAAGLVRDTGIDRFAFAHALVRDTLYASVGASRRARHHAAVASVLDGRSGHETEVARHWLDAGPAHAAKAWRAALDASRVARRAHAHEEAVAWSTAALEALDQDAEATPEDRYEVLMEQVQAFRWASRWTELTEAVEGAVDVAEQIGDAVRAARAAVSTTQGALWQSAPPGQTHDGIVAALRRSLDALPAEDHDLRCRCLVALANEAYYASTFEERRALIDEGLAMATRLGDPVLLMEVHQAAFMALWRGDTAVERLGHAEESLRLARAAGAEQGAVVSASLRAVALSELGRAEELWGAVAEARAEAERLRIPYGLLVLDNLVVPWLAMAGNRVAAQEALRRMREVAIRTGMEQADDAVGGSEVALALWGGDTRRMADAFAEMEGGPFPMTAVVAACLWQAGAEEEASAYLASHTIDLGPDDWFSPLNWGNAGLVALLSGDAALGAEVYARLAPLAGQSCCAGSSNASGPVDGYLACAAAAAGRLDLARAHADDALRLADAWGVPLYAAWLSDLRTRHAF